MKPKEEKKFSKEFLSQFKSEEDVSAYFGDMYKAVIEQMLEGEIEEHLGYAPYDRQSTKQGNYRNGKKSKLVRSKLGTLEVSVPQDRQSSFVPQVVPKRHSVMADLEDRVLSFYANGMSTRDIATQMEEIYGVAFSAAQVSRITDRVLDTVKEWQTRPLDALYPVLWLDGIRFRVKEGSQYKTKVIYLVIGLNMLGHKEVLGMWLDLTESASFWMKVLDDLKQRGVEHVFIGCIDNLAGFSEAIQAVFPDCLTQLCIVHQVRNSLKHVAWGERKDFAQDLKKIYTAANKQAGEEALLEVEEEWGEKYPHVFRSWTSNWDRLSVFYEFPAEIRKMIYTTNIIENLNRVIRKYTKGKTVFPSDDAVQKAVFLAVEHISKKWSMPVRHWQKILAQFAILYPDKVKLEI